MLGWPAERTLLNQVGECEEEGDALDKSFALDLPISLESLAQTLRKPL